jgi:hypothetical protein
MPRIVLRSRAVMALIGIAPLLLTGCDVLAGTSACGLAENDSFTATTQGELNASLVGGSLVNGKRSWTVQVPVLENLCVAAPESENKVSFFVTTTDASFPLIGEGYVQPAYGYVAYSVTLSGTGTDLRGATIDHIGLRQGSNDGKHGYADIKLILTITSQGGEDYDRDVLVSHLRSIQISWHFELLSPD